jgi:regulatory protein
MQQKQIYQYALKCLSHREYSVQQLQTKLQQRFENDIIIKDVLQQLITKKLLSDERFADAYVRMRCQRGYGPLRICMELQARGITAELISETLANYDKSFQDQIKKVQQKKFGRRLPNVLSQKIQQMRFLNYRGFSTSQIKMVLGNDDD